MKALTIAQPYAELIARGSKRVENRTWPTGYRGPLYIHAGKSRDWLADVDGIDIKYQIPVADMAFGAVVAIATLADCIHFDRIQMDHIARKYPWLKDHEHTNGPWCWVLEDVKRLAEPVPARGQQGLFELAVVT